jgi:uncharacterized membrane protein
MPNSFKEPDAQIFPTGRGPKDPTLVLEVGYSEGMSDLQLDVRHWFSRTPLVRLSVRLAQMSLVNLILIQVLLVVLIDIKKLHTTGMPTVTVEHWRRTERPYGEFIYSEVWPYTDNQGLIIYLAPSCHNSLLMVFHTI